MLFFTGIVLRRLKFRMRFDIFIGDRVSVLSLFFRYKNMQPEVRILKRSGGTYEKCYRFRHKQGREIF